MKTQKHMIESFQRTHGIFMQKLNESLDMLDHDISEAKEIDTICTGSWCKAIENSLDELSNYLYSISEPRWIPNSNSKQLSLMRIRLHDMYTKYRNLGEVTIH
jgi:hypothetical protein